MIFFSLKDNNQDQQFVAEVFYVQRLVIQGQALCSYSGPAEPIGRSGLDRTNFPANLNFFHFLTGARQPSWSGLARVKTAESLIRPRQAAQTESTLQKNGVNNSYLNKEKGK